MNHSHDNLSVIHLNIRSLLSHFIELRRAAYINDFDVITLSETWLSPTDPDAALSLTGYDLIRLDRRNAIHRSGGVAIYVKSNIKYSKLESQEVPGTGSLEAVGILIYKHHGSALSQPIAIVSIYRPPQCPHVSFFESLEFLLLSLVTKTSHIVCLGDFNIDVSIPTSRMNQYPLNLLLNFCNHFDLNQLIDQPTRVTDTSSSTIDLILASNLINVTSSGVIDLDVNSDHDAVFCNISFEFQRKKPRVITYRDLDKIPPDLFDTFARNVPWYDILNFDTLDAKVTLLSKLILNLIDMFAPSKTVNLKRPPAPWITQDVRRLMRKRDSAFLKFKRAATPELKSNFKSRYNQLRRETLQLLCHEEKAYFNSISNRSSKDFWNKLQAAGINSDNTSALDPSVFNDPDLINNFFVDSIPTMNASNTLPVAAIPHTDTFNFNPISDLDLYNIVAKIKLTSAASDGISGKMLLICLPYCFSYITHIINESFLTSNFPSAWKHGLVVPLAKVPHPSSLTDLRPITKLPFLSKILEKAAELRIQRYLKSHNLLPKL